MQINSGAMLFFMELMQHNTIYNLFVKLYASDYD